jgi:hypothetical protein
MSLSLRIRLVMVATLLVLVATRAQAGPRVPQVAVMGQALQSLLELQGESLDVHTAQVDAPAFQGIFLDRPALTLIVRRVAGSGTLAMNDADLPSSPLLTLLAGAAPADWSAVVSFQEAPTRVKVMLFDGSGSFQGMSVLPGTSAFHESFAVLTPTRTAWAIDARNETGQPRVLVFAGSGLHAGAAWLAVETGDDGDYADGLWRIEGLAVVTTRRTDWGTLKQRYR